MTKDAKVLVLGGTGLVGGAIVRELARQGFDRVLAPKRSELDLFSQGQVLHYFSEQQPEYVYLAAAKVGGILANNKYRADFIHQNLMIQNHVFEAAHKSQVKKLLFLGSSCIYPKACPQPIKEEYLLTGPLEPTNEPYALAKIAGLKTAQAFRQQYGCQYFSVMPTNLYGPGDNFDPESSHVIPGLMHRMHLAKKNNEKVFKVWGTGSPRREFLYVDDLAEACVFLMEKFTPAEGQDWINVGTGEDISIAELAQLIAKVIGYNGDIVFDASMPDGTPQKLLDVSRVKALGWQAKVDLKSGLKYAYEYF